MEGQISVTLTDSYQCFLKNEKCILTRRKFSVKKYHMKTPMGRVYPPSVKPKQLNRKVSWRFRQVKLKCKKVLWSSSQKDGDISDQQNLFSPSTTSTPKKNAVSRENVCDTSRCDFEIICQALHDHGEFLESYTTPNRELSAELPAGENHFFTTIL